MSNFYLVCTSSSLFYLIWLSPAALGKLAHPDGEVGLARAANDTGILQIVPTMASCSLEVLIMI